MGCRRSRPFLLYAVRNEMSGSMDEKFMICTADIVNSNLWQLFPVINVDKIKDIPCDYPGAMDVPISFFGKFNREQFEILGMERPKIGNRELYVRIFIRNLHPNGQNT